MEDSQKKSNGITVSYSRLICHSSIIYRSNKTLCKPIGQGEWAHEICDENRPIRRALSKFYQRVTLFAISDENISKTDFIEQNIRECVKIDTFLFRNKQIIKIKLFL